MTARIGITRQYRTIDPGTQTKFGPWHSYDTAHVPHFREGLHIEFRDKPEPLKSGLYAMLSATGLPQGSVYTKHLSGLWTKSAGGGTWESITVSDDGVRAAGFVRMVEAK